MKNFRVSLLVALLGSVCVLQPVRSQETGPVDPRLSSVQITIALAGVTVEELLKEATAKTGITMRADPAERAWKVREMPVTVFTKDMPVAHFQTHIARLLDLRWARSGEPGRYVYTLWQDRNARDREARALAEKQNEQQAMLERKWNDALDAYKKSVSSDSGSLPEDAAAFSRFAASDPFGQSYANLLSALGPAALPALIAGQEFSRPFSSLPPAQQAAAMAYYQGLRDLAAKMPRGDQRPPQQPVNWNDVNLTFKPIPNFDGSGDATRMGMLGAMGFEGMGPGFNEFPILDPGSRMADIMAEGLLRVNSGESMESVMQDLGSKFEAEMRSGNLMGRSDDVTADLPDNPLLEKEIEAESEEPVRPMMLLGAVPQQAGLNIFAEDWKRMGERPIRGLKGKVPEVLKEATWGAKLKWTLDGTAIRMTAEDWAERRAAMVPASHIKYWKETIEEYGSLNLDDLAHMSIHYTPEQISTLMTADGQIAANVWPLMDARRKQVFQFYARLDESAVAQAKAAGGLPVASLTHDQQVALLPVLKSNGVNEEDFFVQGATVSIAKEGTRSDLVLNYPPDNSKRILLTRELGRPGGAAARQARPEAGDDSAQEAVQP